MELSVKDLKDLFGTTTATTSKESFLEVGGKYLFRTVTMIYTGEIVRMNETEVELKDAAWIADTGRFYDNLKSCAFNEVEPYPNNVVIFKGAFLDVTKIDKLPRDQK